MKAILLSKGRRLKLKLTLEQYAKAINGKPVNGCPVEALVTDVTCDSRNVKKGMLFAAYRGPEVDGHSFLASAFASGAVAAVVQDKARLGNFPGLVVDNSQKAWSRICALYSGNPSKKMKVIGITGTNGKTTIHWLVHHALYKLNAPCIRIGSLGISAEGRVERSGKVQTLHAGEIVMTTPGAKEIHTSLKLALDAGIETCALETSSHALHQHRVSDVSYDTCVFTNLTPDHLNYHADMEEYFQVKVGLFKQLARERALKNELKTGGAVINTDCPYGRRLVDLAGDLNLPVITFGFERNPDLKIKRFEQSVQGSVLYLEYQNNSCHIQTNLIGNYNGSNLAAAFASLVSLGYDPAQTARALNDLPVVPGRLEPVGNDDVAVFVDYAHTGVGLESLLTAVKPFVQNKLWVLFGCGGGKDPRKRIDMGAAAKKVADCIVLTNDNPKNEDPDKIIEEILQSGCKPVFIEKDRGKAIHRLLKQTEKGDVVFLVGKGHEDYQIIGNETSYFSDREEAIKGRELGLLDKS
ncbi:MAG: UDP-N-acetylmuramoyl-L-alanyl-D-glutamate--2,6-diaminopimelate ligase [Acidobacteria bacterium]|nr:MAG: UDP-N-acetylmuramoyl-L-alanyl-D-glutamate--2,6-diaminopimelate ligase [Acidobacteriota bacterium]